MRRGISPIIATILLIIMTIGIAALMYTWMSGMFAQLTTQASQQAATVGSVSFDIKIAGVDASNKLFNVSVVNKGRVEITMNSTTTSAKISSFDVLTGRLSEVRFCSITNSITLAPGATNILNLNCAALQSNVDITKFRYSIEVTYFGITSSDTYP